MNVPFRQGIVRCRDTGLFTAGPQYVSFNVLDTPAIITVAHGSVDYLIVEQRSVVNAWGPITPGAEQWLYWDINTLTATRTFGITLLRPIVSTIPPTSPQNDQHWFDPSTATTKVWNAKVNRWVEVIRVFACELHEGKVPMSVSANSPLFTGTQVGLTQPATAGTILFDAASGKPLRTVDNKFLTGETRLQATTGATSSIRTEAMIIEAEAQSNMPAYTVVKFVDFGKIDVADYYTPSLSQQYGIIETDANVGDIVVVTMTGVVTNPLWNWTSVNTLLYVDEHGQLTPASIGNSRPVGIVIDHNKIMSYAGGSGGGGSVGSSSTVATTESLGAVKLSVPAAEIGSPVVVGDNDPRVVNALSTTGGSMTGPLTLVSDPLAPLEAATKRYVDNRVSSGGNVHVKTNVGNRSLHIGMPVYSTGVGQVSHAYADSADAASILGLTSSLEIVTGASGNIQTSGLLTATTGQWDEVTGQTGGLTEGALYFLDVAPDGRLTPVPPSVPGQYVVSVGLAVSSTQMFINTQPSILL